MRFHEIIGREPLAEAIIPPDLLAPRYFHGTKKQYIKSVLAHGLYPSDFVASGRRNTAMRPVEGRVYMSPDARLAGLYGQYLLVINRDSLARDLIPDEDEVGAIYHYVTQNHFSDLAYQEKLYGESMPEHLARIRLLNDPKHAAPIRAFRAFMERTLSAATLSKIKFGEYAWYAKGGKTALKKMPPEIMRWLIGLGVHVSVQGRITPDEVWLMKDASKLKSDGSNLADCAERVPFDGSAITDMPPKGPPIKYIGTTEYNKNWANAQKPYVAAFKTWKITAPSDEEAMAEFEIMISRAPHKIVSLVRA